MQSNTPSSGFTYCPLGKNKLIRLSSHAVERFVERIAPGLHYMAGFTRLAAEVAHATNRCPPQFQRPLKARRNERVRASARYGYTPSCIIVFDSESNMVMTVLTYGGKYKPRPVFNKSNMPRKASRSIKNALRQKCSSILDSLSVDD